jgi:integrase/recombinase XerD
MLSLLYDTGMRASELANMRLSGYDPIHGSIEIIGKGRKWRRIYVWPRTVELLNEYIKEWRSTPKPLHHDILIVNRERTALTRSGVNKVCLKYLKKALIKKQVPGAKRSPAHSWRHTAAANMICQGRSLLEVSIRLGHASVETTEKYLQLDLTIRKQRLDELVRFIEQFRPPTQTLMPVELRTTEEMVSFLKSV